MAFEGESHPCPWVPLTWLNTVFIYHEPWGQVSAILIFTVKYQPEILKGDSLVLCGVPGGSAAFSVGHRLSFPYSSFSELFYY